MSRPHRRNMKGRGNVEKGIKCSICRNTKPKYNYQCEFWKNYFEKVRILSENLEKEYRRDKKFFENYGEYVK